MEKQAEVKIQSNPKMTDIIIQSLSPELNRKNFRTQIDISSNSQKDVVKLFIKAKDVNALRAALNSYLRWIKCIMEINQELTNKGDENGRT